MHKIIGKEILKKAVKSIYSRMTLAYNKLISRNLRQNIDILIGVRKNEKFSLAKKIRQINYLVNSLIKTLLSRNFPKKSESKFP